jgi:two-component system chemotaxis response regulator CheB
MKKACRVLVVDDSSTMRKLIRQGLGRDPRLRVVGEAGTAQQARELVKTLEPDIMTLDVEMPGMDGLEFLSRLMVARPMPVVMVSSLTGRGSDAAIRALSLGAMECIEKPRFGTAQETFSQLADLLVTLSAAQPSTRPGRSPASREREYDPPFQWNGRYLLIGASTGGVDALETIFAAFPSDAPPTLVTQHMPAPFLASFAERLNSNMCPNIRLASDGDVLTQGNILIAPGGRYHLRLSHDGAAQATLWEGPKRNGHRPSVDEMFLSALPMAHRSVAAVLTGMGRDGAAGMLQLRSAGARTFAQDGASSIVYGMPRVATQIGAAGQVVPLAQMASTLLGACASQVPMGAEA